jgi:cytochrome b561
MIAITRPTRYAVSSRWVHWLTFAFVALAYLFIELKSEAARGSPLRELLKQAHFWSGFAVLLLLLPRVWLRSRQSPPPITPTPGAWSRRLAALTHIVLYAFLLVQPLLGLAALELSGKALALPGGATLPLLGVSPDKDFAHSLEEIHETLGNIFYGVIALHIAAALWHHLVRRDDTLKRML